jgi:acyl dehydratase
MTVTPDPSFAGRTYPPGAEHVVSAAKVTEFARATGATSPVHSDPAAAREAGFADVVATPTFLVSLAPQTEAAYIQDPASGIDFSRVVHGDESFELHRTVVAGDVLIPTLTVESVRSVGGHAMIATRVDMTDLDGEAVASVHSGLVVRGE